MDTKKVLFGRKFRGYDRRAVNNYILEMNRAFSEESNEREGALAQTQKALSESCERIASLEAELKACEDVKKAEAERVAELGCELEQCKSENAELNALAAKRAEQIAQLSELAEEKNAQLAALTEDTRRAQDALGELRAQREDENARYVRELAELRARHDAENARYASEIEALKAEYDLEEGERIAALETSCTQMRERMSAELRELTKKCLREVLSGVKGMRDDLGRVQTTSNVRADRMIRSIDEYEADMKNEVRRLLEEFKADGLE